MLGHTEASRTTSAVSQEARTGRGLDRPATKNSRVQLGHAGTKEPHWGPGGSRPNGWERVAR